MVKSELLVQRNLAMMTCHVYFLGGQGLLRVAACQGPWLTEMLIAACGKSGDDDLWAHQGAYCCLC